ncbi:MAG: caspase family protein [Candidatus Aminicenantes bacterium]|nr:caspase family protein [Candidatus Aminicenantes bacterium]
MSREFYALLVGINEYPQPVPDLRGCINDVNSLHDYLRESVHCDLRVEILKNQDATRENIIRLFRSHLGLAGKDDVVLFYFSGHGSQEMSAPEFKEYFPSGKNETLVWYDSRTHGGLDLADKELAVLLEEIARGEPHIAVILDCCHSGSATRAIDDFNLGRVRQVPPARLDYPRPLETYLDGYYQNRKPVVIPQSKHILMSACDRHQKAWETKTGNGVFTSTLLEVLGKAHGNISYADLFTRCRAAILKQALDQTPQFETYRQFMPYLKFLEGQPLTSNRSFLVYFEDNNWKMDGGAIHGLTTDPDKKIEAALYPFIDESPHSTDNPPAGYAAIISVGAQKSILQPDFPCNPALHYQAEIISLPIPPLPVYLEGDNKGKTWLEEASLQRERGFAFTNDPAAAKYRLSVFNNQLRLFPKDNPLLLQGADGNPSETAPYMFSVLEKVAAWERALTLQNKQTSFCPADIDFQLVETLDDGTEWEYPDNQVTLDFEKINNAWKCLKAKLKIRNNTQQELYYTLVYFSRQLGIYILKNDAIIPGKDFVTLWGEGEDDNFYLPDDVNDACDIFKVIVCTEKPDDFLLLQQDPLEPGEIKNFPVTRGKAVGETKDIGTITPKKKLNITNDWFTKTLTVKTIRQLDRVSQNDTSLANKQILIKGHSSFRAGLSLTGSRFNQKGIDLGTLIQGHLQGEGHQLINFSPGRGDNENTLELSDIYNEESLRQEPLEILLKQEPGRNEYILPLTFDGVHFLPVGSSFIDENGNVSIKIHSIPASPDESRKSLGKALKLCFVKLVLKRGDVNMLRWVEYRPDGNCTRHRENLKEKVEKADRILLLIHGIIGDTEPMATGLQWKTDPTAGSMADQYDLILAFDYENLNTPIEETARLLKKQLQEVGLAEHRSKKITILSHSMGGLVSRWFIEQEGGNKWVERLIMAGTPNNGSAFGDMTDYRDLAIKIMALSLNFLKSSLAYSGALILALNESKKITRTLEQMKQDSAFIHYLNGSGDPHVHYTILAGDISHYETGQDRFFAGLIEKIETGIGKIVYGTQPNDIAVSVASIKNIDAARTPSPKKFDLVCHHLNYFQSESALTVLSRELGIVMK